MVFRVNRYEQIPPTFFGLLVIWFCVPDEFYYVACANGGAVAFGIFFVAGCAAAATKCVWL